MGLTGEKEYTLLYEWGLVDIRSEKLKMTVRIKRFNELTKVRETSTNMTP